MHQHRIMIADDNRTNQLLFERILQNAGYETHTVGSGSAVLEELSVDNNHDAILIDLCMPEIDGIETIKLIRLAEIGRGGVSPIPIIAISADDNDRTRACSLLAGANSFLTQPNAYSRIADLLQELIRNKADKYEVSSSEDFSRVSWVADKVIPLDRRNLKRLVDDLGPDFIRDMAVTIKADGEVALNFMQAAVTAGDVFAFRQQVLSVLSSTASLGGSGIRRVYDISKSLQGQYLTSAGPVIIARLQYEVEAILKALAEYRGDSSNTVADV